jgi:hypothetical protein
MKFNNIEPRTREERAALKDKEKIEDYRLKQRIGGYHKYVDNAQISQPDPISSHFISESERFDKDFASADKRKREVDYQSKLEVIERKRVEKFERDLQRWKYMDDEEGREKHRLGYMNEHYLTGKKNTGGAAYNVISLDYDNSNEGQTLKRKDDDSKVRALVRSKNIDMRSNCGYNVLTGDQRAGIDVPQHEIYNPYDYNAAQKAGKNIVFGNGPQEGYPEDNQNYAQQNYAPQDQPQEYQQQYQQPPQEYQQQYQQQPQEYQQQYQQQPQQEYQQQYQQQPQEYKQEYEPQDNYQQYNQPAAQAPAYKSGGGVQLPIASKDYNAFGGNGYNEGAGTGDGYSQQMQAQPANFQGGTGSKFY